jgi:hypothetical protein
MTDRHTHGWNEERHMGFRMGTLWFRKSDMDGDVTLSSAYDELDVLSKMDLLEDVIGLLNREYDSLFIEEEIGE